MKATYLAVLALLAAPAGAAEQQLTQEQEDACGAILCLAGGSGVAECTPYLARFYAVDPEDRKDFLNQCPDSGLSQGAIGELATYGQTCQPDKLDDYLNAQLCTPAQEAAGLPCREPSPQDWQILCASYYAELTDEDPPKLIERCAQEPDDTGAYQTVCSQVWVQADYVVGSWCEDKDESCQETEVKNG